MENQMTAIVCMPEKDLEAVVVMAVLTKMEQLYLISVLIRVDVIQPMVNITIYNYVDKLIITISFIKLIRAQRKLAKHF